MEVQKSENRYHVAAKPLGGWKWRFSRAQKHPWQQDGIQGSPLRSPFLNTTQRISGVCSMFALYTHWLSIPQLNTFSLSQLKMPHTFVLLISFLPPPQNLSVVPTSGCLTSPHFQGDNSETEKN